VTFTNGDTGEPMHAVAEIDFPRGAKASFFEIEPGDVVYAISGPGMTEVPGRDLVGQRLTAQEVYERLSGREAPQALLEADARAAELETTMLRLPRPTADEGTALTRPRTLIADRAASVAGVARTQEALRLYDCKEPWQDHDEWFNCTFCAANNELADWDFTWMWSTGSGSYSRYDINRAVDNLWLYSGASLYHRVRFRTWYSWTYPVDTHLPNWYYTSWGRVNWGTDFDVSSIVNDAAGDGYHWCAYGI
jgi:hypothetical protein